MTEYTDPATLTENDIRTLAASLNIDVESFKIRIALAAKSDAEFRARRLADPEVRARHEKWQAEERERKAKFDQDLAHYRWVTGDQLTEVVDKARREDRVYQAQKAISKEFPLLVNSEQNAAILKEFIDPQRDFLNGTNGQVQWSQDRIEQLLRGAILANRLRLTWISTAKAPLSPQPKESLIAGQLPLDSTVAEMRRASIEQLKDLSARQIAAKRK